ncbi:MAG: mechanosensitive ion channel family protein [Opitutae bacterium]|nr:mechanosensitive ion channel family protein [Opitutae bacterium]MCD8299450.1 mechanosensitive ion channel family protein [Opitutae bacterium]
MCSAFVAATTPENSTPAGLSDMLCEVFPDTRHTLLFWAFLLGGFFVGIFFRKILLRCAKEIYGRTRARLFVAFVADSVARTALFLFSGIGVALYRAFLLRYPDVSPGVGSILARIFWIFIVVAIAIFLWHMVRIPVEILKRHTANKPIAALAPLVSALLKIAIFAVGVLVILRITTDTPPAEIITMLGIGGLALGLAAQDTVKNFFGSAMLLIDRPFSPGDMIDAGSGTVGTVESIGLRSTRIRALDGSRICVPNSDLANRTVRSISARTAIRDDFSLDLEYSTPPEKVVQAIEILREIFDSPAVCRGSLAPRITFAEFAESSLRISATIWFAPADTVKFLAFKSEVNLQILQKFNAAKIEFAFPTREIRVKCGSEPAHHNGGRHQPAHHQPVETEAAA